ncbi:MAG: adenylate/guanylate cyclase domain-containing protein [Stellaceae bacterium]
MPVDVTQTPPQLLTFDDALGRRIIAMHVWAVRAGLRGATAYDLFDGYCQRLVIDGVPLWRAHAATETLHPQWSGFGYIWRRDLNAIQPEQYGHDDIAAPEWVSSPLNALIRRAEDGEDTPTLRRRLEAGPEERDFPVFDEFFAAGATDHFSQLFVFGEHHDRSQGSGAIYSFTTDRRGGFADDDVMLLQATLPALSLAIKAHVGHVIAAGLLQTYLGEDAGRRVHAGAVARGSVESLHAVLWFADIRGFTTIADTTPGSVVIELLDEVFETLTATLRPRGGQVLKFLGDGMLATFAIEAAGPAETCRRALDAAAEAMQALDALNAARAAAGKPAAAVDLALHIGDVLYGNVGATDRLDFTVIGPAVNEVARIEALCEPLGRKVLISAELAAAAEDGTRRLEPLGRHALRGVREAREIFALDLR